MYREENKYNNEDLVSAVQDGDFEFVRESISENRSLVHAVDDDGISLLHWAAINNRISIAHLLLENGFQNCSGGGVLNESPLQWAIRKKFYAMAELLVQSGLVEIAHKNVYGSDTLHTACKLGDVQAVFLLLQWGADPNSIDNGGDSAILMLVRSQLGMAARAPEESTGKVAPTVQIPFHACMDTINLLLRFGANPMQQNTFDGNTALHLISLQVNEEKVNLTLVFQLHQAGRGYSVTQIENNRGLTIYDAAAQTGNRKMTRFLLDILFFNFFPYWLPSFSVAAVGGGLYLLLRSQPLWSVVFYGSLLYGSIMCTPLLQKSIIDHSHRVVVGLGSMIILVLSLTFYYDIGPFVSPMCNLICLTCFLAFTYSAIKFNRKSPLVSRVDNATSLVAKIIHSSPLDGPDEEIEAEIELLQLQEKRNQQASKQKMLMQDLPGNVSPYRVSEKSRRSEASSSVRFVKDSQSGVFVKMIVKGGGIRAAESDSAVQIRRPRSLGPRLCGCCVADKRSISISALYKPKKITPSQPDNETNTKPSRRRGMRSDSGKDDNGTIRGTRKNVNANSSSSKDVSALVEDDTSMETGGADAYTGDGGIYSSVDGAFGSGNGLGGRNKNTVISLATHCNSCNTCVVDLDHHSAFFGNCVGKGNRRLFMASIVLAGLCCLLFFSFSMWVHYSIQCGYIEGMWIYRVFAVQMCALCNHPLNWILTWVSFLGGCSLFGLGTTEVNLIMLESTLTGYIRDERDVRFKMQLIPNTRKKANFFTFLRTGSYNIGYPKSSVSQSNPNTDRETASAQTSKEDVEIEVLVKQKETALVLLSQIDQQMELEGMERGETTRGKREISTVEKCRESEKGADIRAGQPASLPLGMSDSDSQILPLLERDGPPEKSFHAREDEVDPAYDREFVQSSFNNELYYLDPHLGEDRSEGDDESDSDRNEDFEGGLIDTEEGRGALGSTSLPHHNHTHDHSIEPPEEYRSRSRESYTKGGNSNGDGSTGSGAQGSVHSTENDHDHDNGHGHGHDHSHGHGHGGCCNSRAATRKAWLDKNKHTLETKAEICMDRM